jgi:hypothetical protein
VINITGCRGARLLVWLILNDRVQPSLIAGVRRCVYRDPCKVHTPYAIKYLTGRGACMATPSCKIHTVYIYTAVSYREMLVVGCFWTTVKMMTGPQGSFCMSYSRHPVQPFFPVRYPLYTHSASYRERPAFGNGKLSHFCVCQFITEKCQLYTDISQFETGVEVRNVSLITSTPTEKCQFSLHSACGRSPVPCHVNRQECESCIYHVKPCTVWSFTVCLCGYFSGPVSRRANPVSRYGPTGLLQRPILHSSRR